MKAVLAAVFFCVFCAPLGAAPIKVFVMAGQSNMTGGGLNRYLSPELAAPQNDVLFKYWIRTLVDTESDGFESLRPSVARGSSYGSELSFGRTVADALDEDVAIIKVAANGTSLDAWWTPRWQNRLFPVLTEQVSDGLAALTTDGYTPELAAFVWVQGTADSGFESGANAYSSNLESLVGGFRTEFDVPDLTFIQNLQHVDTRGRDYVDVVRSEKLAYTDSDPNAHIVSLDDLDLKGDFIHYTGPTQIELGERLAFSYLNDVSVVPEPSVAVLTGLLGVGLLSRQKRRNCMYRNA